MGPRFEPDANERERGRWINVLANLPVFERAKGTTVERVLGSSAFHRHAPGDAITTEGTPATHAHFLIEGTARVSQTDGRGSEYTPKIFVAPTHFGDLAGLAKLERYRSSVEAIAPSVSARAPFDVLFSCLEEDHGLCLSWLLSVARQHAVTIDADRQNVFGGLFARLANVFLSYGDAFGVEQKDLVGIDYALSYAKLARDIGCSRRRAITLVQTLSKNGLVKATGGAFLINARRLRQSLIPGRLSLTYSLDELDEGNDAH